MTLILTIDPAQDISDIILRLSKANLEISSVMPMINIIIVEASASAIETLEIIPGIIAIESDQEITISHDVAQDGPRVVRRSSKGLFDGELDHGFISHTIN